MTDSICTDPIRSFLETESLRLGNQLKALEISWCLDLSEPYTVLITLTSIPNAFSPSMEGKQVVLDAVLCGTRNAYQLLKTTAQRFYCRYNPDFPKLTLRLPFQNCIDCLPRGALPKEE